MKLEILTALPTKTTQSYPVLFVHGSFVDATCWSEYFLEYFAAHGYAAYAVSLRGHGKSQGYEHLMEASLADYVEDVLQVAETFEQPPILVGHSMGGMVIQHYLAAQHPTSAVVLMNSVPPSGLWDSAFYMAFTDPLALQQLTLMQNVSLQFAAPSAMKRILFSNEVPEEKLQKYMSHVQAESQRAVLDMLGLDLPHFKQKPTQPILVLGAQEDAFLPTVTIEATARFYGTGATLYPKMGHAMMLEVHWQRVADDILAWLTEQLPNLEQPAAALTTTPEPATTIETEAPAPTKRAPAKRTTRSSKNALRKTPAAKNTTKSDAEKKTTTATGRGRRKKSDEGGYS